MVGESSNIAASVMEISDGIGAMDVTCTGEEAQDNLPEHVLLNDLVILPPRQKESNSSKGLLLPPLRAEEPVQSLRAALSEVVGFAHMTSFRFELEERDPTPENGLENIKIEGIVSPFTGKDVKVMVPLQVKSLEISDHDSADVVEKTVALDEYGDLTPLLDKGLKNGSGFRIVLECYNTASVKDHVNRLRSLFDGNAPRVTTLSDERTIEVGDDTEEQETRKKKQLPPLPSFSTLSVKFDSKDLDDFFYRACGEDANLLKSTKQSKDDSKPKSSKKKKGKTVNEETENTDQDLFCEKMCRWNTLEESTHVPCTVTLSGFHPPPPHRRLVGDIAYFTVKPEATADSPQIHITATTLGFYVNKTNASKGKLNFDPSPAVPSYFSHTLLDCLLQASSTLSKAWVEALEAAKAKDAIVNEFNTCRYVSLFPVAVRGDFDGFKSAYAALRASRYALDASLIVPSWLASVPRGYLNANDPWNSSYLHAFNSSRAEEDFHSTFGVDVRNGAIRDWNEELQLAREMPTTTLNERIERARLIHKVMTEFGEASLLGVKAIVEGQITPMNPNEPTRSQVYLHNNIFFSRAVDAGSETFKIATGDRAARKAANRDVQCIGTFHRMEKSGLYTLATVLIDHLGTRFVCQSILPGILIGEKAHTLLYGSVETGMPLKWDEQLHKLLEDKIGEGMMIATRPVYRLPLTNERMEEINKAKKLTPLFAENERKIGEALAGIDPDSVILTCVPVEAKAILGSDQRKYVLDFGRLTSRDANWVSKEKGGTGNLDTIKQPNGNGAKGGHHIPPSLDDDEWTMCVLRPELVTRFTQVALNRYLKSRKTNGHEQKPGMDAKDETISQTPDAVPADELGQESSPTDPKSLADKETSPTESEDKDKDSEIDHDSSKLTKDDLNYLRTLRLNINVFLPHIRPFGENQEEAAAQLKNDEQLARDVANFLFNDVLPKVTRAVRDGSVHQLPVDGRTLTEFLHRSGVNCRYLGQLAYLAKEQEERDAKTEADLKKGLLTVLERRTMPKCWLELIECEIVARAAKHVLDRYLTDNGGIASCQPAQTIASFLSALVSEGEETAAQTETRMEKRASLQPDDDDLGMLTLSDVGGAGDAVPFPIRGRTEVWNDIESEVGRRFRYSLTLYNNGNKAGRALYIPLLRRICQRSGIRLVAKKYEVGGKCLCSSGTIGGRLSASYPILPLDIVDVVPLMKHSAAYGEGFTPCAVGQTLSLPSLQVSLQDARATLERAHIQTSTRALGKALELAQEAASLYQRVTENAAHPGVIESMELMATIFLEAGDPFLAAANGEKALGLSVQNTGFDSAGSFNAHMSLFQMLFAAREMDRAVKHLRAAIYLLEIMAGPRHIEHFTAYHKLGSTYSHADYEGKYLSTALEIFREASKRDSCDRLMEGIMAKNFAKVLAGLENYKDALEYETTAFRTLAIFLGKDHHLTKDSEAELQNLTKLAVAKGNKAEENDKRREDAAKAEAIAADLAAEEEKKISKMKKKGKK